ncbi:hypothetical protein, partial [Acidaminococcus provencensis]|uniref:hypothetical protein n=1 Tax=Acidaminococcus provencensis TaxID=2058289 RepID=UPI0022E32A03
AGCSTYYCNSGLKKIVSFYGKIQIIMVKYLCIFAALGSLPQQDAFLRNGCICTACQKALFFSG